jgi:hypothetical protein
MPKKSITALYAEFQKAHAAYWACTYPRDDARQKQCDAAIDKAAVIAQRIEKTPADSVDEMLIKVRLMIWDMGLRDSKNLDALHRWRPSYPDDVGLASLRDDLRRLQAAPPRRARRTAARTRVRDQVAP